MTVPPEIKRLRENCVVNVWRCPECGRAIAEIEHHEGYCDGTLATPHPRRAWEVDAYLALADAEQAVRDTEARVARELYALGASEAGIRGEAREQAFREAVEALREDAVMEAAMQHDDVAAMQRYAADFLERRFLTSEGEDDA